MASALKLVRKYFPAVEKVIDADSPLEVQVESKDLKAQPKNHTSCALAKACTRNFGLTGAIISLKSAYMIIGALAMRYKNPEAVTHEIVSFDKHSLFTPGLYRLRAPSPTEKLGHEPRGKGHGPADRGPGNKPPRSVTTNVRAYLK